jgi:signal transduction histidine kinase
MNVATQFRAAPDYDRDPRFRATFEGIAIGIGICRLDGRIVEANPTLCRMLGYSPQELAGAHAGELALDIGDREIDGREIDRQRYSSSSNELRDERLDEQLGERDDSPGDLSEHHGSAHDFPSQDFSQDFSNDSPHDFPHNDRWLGELMRGERGSFEMERLYQRKDGSKLWAHLTMSLGRSARCQSDFLIAMVEDATERKCMEEHLRAAEKMEVIGRLAGGIVHDFNNLLTGILLYCDLLGAGLETGLETVLEAGGPGSGTLDGSGLEAAGRKRSELSQHVEEVRMAGEQGAALTRQLLAIARKQAAEPRPVRINEVVSSTKNLLQRLIGEQIELVVVLDSVLDGARDSGAGLVLADPAQLRQILLNLVLNARDAMPQGGRITLSTWAAEIPDEFGSARRAVTLAVTDDGRGMNAETRARLFEPFFTTKNPGEGTGLGLATVQRIVSGAGGKIEVRSEPGRGTSIEVFFPAIETSSKAFPQPVKPGSLPRDL